MKDLDINGMTNIEDVIDMIKDTIDEGRLEDAKDYLEQFKDHYVYETFKESGLVRKTEDA
jgi:soluble cytochrome b562|tara:strand:+ start:52 stop:231 length:180 start_codon:yes stop_codon:yes gene_type:complete